MQKKSSIVRGALALTLTTVGFSAAAAQDSTAGAQADLGENSESLSSVEVTGIIVTAQKRAEKLFDVPIAISAITGDQIEDRGYANMTDLLQLAPGVSVTGGNTQIRGISSLFGDATIGYYLDELPFTFLGSGGTPDVRSWDLERVEILRGPQGTLYGANSMGGTVRILTKNPNLNEVEVKGEGSLGFIKDGQEQYEFKGAVNIPLITDKVAIRIAGSYLDYNGFVDSPLGKNIDDRKITTLRAKITIAPVDNLRLTLSAWNNDTDMEHPSNARRNRVSTNPFANPASTDFQIYGAVLEYNAPWFDVVSTSSLLKYDSASLTSAYLAPGFPPIIAESSLRDTTFSQEIRLVSTGKGPFRWTTGAFYKDSEEDVVANFPGLFEGTQNPSSKQWAIFGEGTYSFAGDRLEATVGARYFEDKRVNIDAVSGVGFPPVEGKFTAFNPKFNLAWRATDTNLFYATVAKGFRSGQNQPAISILTAAAFGLIVPTNIDPETLWSYEIGTKNTFLDGKLAIEGAVYYNDWKDLQVTVIAGGILGAMVNAGKAHSMGVDLSLAFKASKELSLAISGNINESKLGSTVPTAFTKGDRIIFVPSYTFNASATYIKPLSDSLKLFAFAELQQTGDRVLKAQGFSGVSDPQSIVNLRIGVEGKKWGAYLTAQNLLDENGAIYPAIYSTDFNTITPQPRTLGILLRANY